MIDINKLKLTDMGNPELIPQLVEEMNTKFIKEEEKIICEKLFDLDIDKDILINQTQEINRLNDILREYKELEEQGLLLKLPFPLGTKKLYLIDGYEIDEIDATGITLYKANENAIRPHETVICVDYCDFYYDDFGKTVFLTKEERVYR